MAQELGQVGGAEDDGRVVEEVLRRHAHNHARDVRHGLLGGRAGPRFAAHANHLSEVLGDEEKFGA